MSSCVIRGREPAEEDAFSSSGTLYGAMESFGVRDRRDELPTTSHRMMKQKIQPLGKKGEGSSSARTNATNEGVTRDKSAFGKSRGSGGAAVVGEGGVAKFRVKSARGPGGGGVAYDVLSSEANEGGSSSSAQEEAMRMRFPSGRGAVSARVREHSVSTIAPNQSSRHGEKRDRTMSITDGMRGEAVLADRVTHLNTKKPKLIQGLKKLY